MRESTVCPSCDRQINFPRSCSRRNTDHLEEVEPSSTETNSELTTLNEMTNMIIFSMVYMLLEQNWYQFVRSYPLLLFIPFPVTISLLVNAIRDPSLLDRLERINLNIRPLAIEMADLVSRSLENAHR